MGPVKFLTAEGNLIGQTRHCYPNGIKFEWAIGARELLKLTTSGCAIYQVTAAQLLKIDFATLEWIISLHERCLEEQRKHDDE